MTDEEKYIEEVQSHIDYEVGDWVETCNMLPGIVEKIDVKGDDVEVFYPHYALNPKYYPYKGGSHCSIVHCGVHKITPQYASMLLAIGEEKLKELWADEETKDIPWEEVVENYYKNKL